MIISVKKAKTHLLYITLCVLFTLLVALMLPSSIYAANFNPEKNRIVLKEKMCRDEIRIYNDYDELRSFKVTLVETKMNGQEAFAEGADLTTGD